MSFLALIYIHRPGDFCEYLPFLRKVRFNDSLLPSFSTFHENKNRYVLYRLCWIYQIYLFNSLQRHIRLYDKLQRGSKQQANDKTDFSCGSIFNILKVERGKTCGSSWDFSVPDIRWIMSESGILCGWRGISKRETKKTATQHTLKMK